MCADRSSLMPSIFTNDPDREILRGLSYCGLTGQTVRCRRVPRGQVSRPGRAFSTAFSIVQVHRADDGREFADITQAGACAAAVGCVPQDTVVVSRYDWLTTLPMRARMLAVEIRGSARDAQIIDFKNREDFRSGFMTRVGEPWIEALRRRSSA